MLKTNIPKAMQLCYDICMHVGLCVLGCACVILRIQSIL